MHGVITRRNLIANPSFEDGVEGWQPTTGATVERVSRGGRFTWLGGRAGEFVARISRMQGTGSYFIQQSGGQRPPVVPGKWYALGVALQSDNTVRTWLYWRDANNANILPHVQSSVVATGADGLWLVISGQAPEGATQAATYIGSATTASTELWADAVILVEADTEDEALQAVGGDL